MRSKYIRLDPNSSIDANGYKEYDVILIDEFGKLPLTKKLNLGEWSGLKHAWSTLIHKMGINSFLFKTFINFLDSYCYEPPNRKKIGDYGLILSINKLPLPDGYESEIMQFNQELTKQINDFQETDKNSLPDPKLMFILELLKIWESGEGAITIKLMGECDLLISIETENTHITSILNKAKFIALDASPDQLTLKSIVQKPVLEVCEESPRQENLSITSVIVRGLRFSNAETKEDQLVGQSVKSVIESIKQSCEERGLKHDIIGLKACNYEKYWGHHSRGSNEFFEAETDVLVAVGQFQPNINDLRSTFVTLTGDYDEQNFSEWYSSKVFAEVVQASGRLRAHSRPHKQHEIIFVHETLPIRELAEMYGCEFNQYHAIELSPVAGTKAQRTRLKILNAHEQLKSEGVKITQQAITDKTGLPIDTLKNQFRNEEFTFEMLDRGQHLTGKGFQAKNAKSVIFPLYLLREFDTFVQKWLELSPSIDLPSVNLPTYYDSSVLTNRELIDIANELISGSGFEDLDDVFLNGLEVRSSLGSKVFRSDILKAIDYLQRAKATKEAVVIAAQQEQKQPVTYEWSEVKEGLKSELKRIGWTAQDATDYIGQVYKVSHTREMTNPQILEFWEYLKDCCSKALMSA